MAAYPPDHASHSALAAALEHALDEIAPLGKGTLNAAAYFQLFVDTPGGRGPRAADLDDALQRFRETGRGLLAPDDPLLLEAEPWMHQATLRLEGDSGTPSGVSLNFLHVEILASSWLACTEGGAPDAAGDHARRVIRLGRLLRQDDVSHGQRAGGLGIVERGLQRLAELDARDPSPAAATRAREALALSRQLRALELPCDWVFTVAREMSSLRGAALQPPRDEAVEGLMRCARRSDMPRSWRIVTFPVLRLVASGGTRHQRGLALDALKGLAADADPVIARAAARWLAQEWDPAAPFFELLGKIG